MNMFGAPWFEIRVDDSARPAYVLMVELEETGAGCVVIAPKNNYSVVHREPSYDLTLLWLSEDEYRLVEGRMLRD
jgi:hypothetical protein